MFISGCAVIPIGGRQPVTKHLETESAPDDGYEDYVGVMHVHTNYSHDAHGRFEDVVRAANVQRLDYVVISEHNTLQPLRDGLQGWHGTTLVVIGTEIAARGGHYLALNVTKDIEQETLTTQQTIDEVSRQGGFGFIAHPHFKKHRWTDWSATGFTGIEVYNFAHDTLDQNRLHLVLWTLMTQPYTFYNSLIDRPYDPLHTWDELIKRHGRVTAIGSTDAHEFHVMGLKFAPYEMMFQLSRTHLLIPSDAITPERIYGALRQGHAYLAIELITEASGFTFLVQDRQRVMGVMGDEVSLEPNLEFVTWLPAPAKVTLLKDGRPYASTAGQSWEIPVTSPGVYRIEAVRHGTPWIFSNPIYVRPSEEQHTADSTKQ